MDDDIHAALAKIRAEQGDPVQGPGKDIHADLAEIRGGQGMSNLLTEQGIMGAPAAPVTPPPTVRPDVTSALPKNRPNASGDIGSTFANPGKQGKFISNVVASHLLNTAQGIPGVEAAEAGIGTLGGKSYDESLAGLRGRIKRDVGPAAGLEKMIGAAPLAAVLPGSMAASGAILGGADRLLQADPNVGIPQRLAEGAGGAAVGGLAGHVLGKVVTAGRAAAATNPADNILARQAARAESAGKLYRAAEAEGKLNGATPAIQAYLAEPEIASRVQALQGLQEFKNVPADSPEMLDALHKTLSDESHAISKGMAVQDPSKPNTGRFLGRNVRSLKDKLLTAMETPNGTGPAMMPSYRDAVEDFARQSKEIDALGKGMTASATNASGKRPSFSQIMSKQTKTPETYAQWAADPNRTQGELRAASEGILGDTKNAFHEPGKTLAPFRRATGKATDLLRSTPTQQQSVTELLQKLGLTSLNANLGQP